MYNPNLDQRKIVPLRGRCYVVVRDSPTVDLLTADMRQLLPLYQLSDTPDEQWTFIVESEGFLVADALATVDVLNTGPFVRFDRSPEPLPYVSQAPVVDAYIVTKLAYQDTYYYTVNGVNNPYAVFYADIENTATGEFFPNVTLRKYAPGVIYPVVGQPLPEGWDIFKSNQWQSFYDYVS